MIHCIESSWWVVLPAPIYLGLSVGRCHCHNKNPAPPPSSFRHISGWKSWTWDGQNMRWKIMFPPLESYWILEQMWNNLPPLHSWHSAPLQRWKHLPVYSVIPRVPRAEIQALPRWKDVVGCLLGFGTYQ